MEQNRQENGQAENITYKPTGQYALLANQLLVGLFGKWLILGHKLAKHILFLLVVAEREIRYVVLHLLDVDEAAIRLDVPAHPVDSHLPNIVDGALSAVDLLELFVVRLEPVVPLDFHPEELLHVVGSDVVVELGRRG